MLTTAQNCADKAWNVIRLKKKVKVKNRHAFLCFLVTEHCFTETNTIQRVTQKNCSAKLILNQPTKWGRWWRITARDKFRRRCRKLELQPWGLTSRRAGKHKPLNWSSCCSIIIYLILSYLICLCLSFLYVCALRIVHVIIYFTHHILWVLHQETTVRTNSFDSWMTDVEHQHCKSSSPKRRLK